MTKNQTDSNENQQNNKGETIKEIIHWTLLAALIIITITFRLNGTLWCPDHEIITIEHCAGTPNNLTQMQQLAEQGILQEWTPEQQKQYKQAKQIININLTT